jgi:hypothetical protein
VILEMMIAIIMLIHTVSLELQLPSHVTIHNQCLNVTLVSPVYFGNGVVFPKLSDQQMNIGTGVRTSFEISTIQDVFEGALLYKLLKNVESDNQLNMVTSITETNKDNKKCAQMFVAWKVKDSEPFVHVTLIEHTKEFTWNRDKLKKLYDRNRGWLKAYYNSTSDTWFIDVDMVLKMIVRVRYLKGNIGLNISISKCKDDYAIRPLYVDPER